MKIKIETTKCLFLGLNLHFVDFKYNFTENFAWKN
jgi:hypothetical protein